MAFKCKGGKKSQSLPLNSFALMSYLVAEEKQPAVTHWQRQRQFSGLSYFRGYQLVADGQNLKCSGISRWEHIFTGRNTPTKKKKTRLWVSLLGKFQLENVTLNWYEPAPVTDSGG